MQRCSLQFCGFFIFVVLLAILMLVISVYNIEPDNFYNMSLGILFFTCIFFAAQQLPVSLPENAEVTVDFAIVISSLIIFGTKASILMIFISSIFTELKRIKIMPLYKAVFNICLYIVMVGSAGLAYEKFVTTQLLTKL